MAAAHRVVHESGYRQSGRVMVVEARGRLGGRTATDRRWGVPLELGAQWIHESDGNPLTRLATRFGLRSIVTNYDSVDLREETGQEVADAPLQSGADPFRSAHRANSHGAFLSGRRAAEQVVKLLGR